MRFPLVVALAAVVAAPTSAWAQTERDAVIAAAQRMFDGMAARDPEAIRATLLPEAMLFVVDDRSGRRVVRATGAGQFADGFRGEGAPIIERMWNPEVRVDGNIAIIWTPYDLYRGTEFSHCGIDAFQLVKLDTGWKIAAVSYTRRTAACADPLGPPKPPDPSGAD